MATRVISETIDLKSPAEVTSWYYGIAITGDSTTPTVFPLSDVQNAVEGDTYLNTNTSSMYQCVTGGVPNVATWKYVGNIAETVDLNSIEINQSQVLGLTNSLNNLNLNSVARTQTIYYQSSSMTIYPDPPTVWITSEEAGGAGYYHTNDTVVNSNKLYYQLVNGVYVIVTPVGTENPDSEGWYEYLQDFWTCKRAAYNIDKPYTYKCEQSETIGGRIDCTPVLIDDTTTVINGGNILTHTILAEHLNIGQYMVFDYRKSLLGSYALSTDTTTDISKLYFTREGLGLPNNPYVYTRVVIDGAENPVAEGWFEYVSGKPNNWTTTYQTYYKEGTHDDEYVSLEQTPICLAFTGEYMLSADTSVKTYKNYFSLSGSTYSLEIPVGDENPIEEGWYEIQATKFYQTNYSAPQILIGDKNAFAVVVDNTQITFWYNWQKVAFINGQKMEIPESVMLREMIVGHDNETDLDLWSWREHDQNLQLKWVGN